MTYPRLFSALFLILSAAGLASCHTPTTPSSSDASGNWTVTFTPANIVVGGECVGTTLFGGTTASTLTYTLQVTQTGSALTATASATRLRNAVNYTGTAGTTSFNLSGEASSVAVLRGFQCSNGALRDIRLASSTINISANSGSTAVGNEVDSYDVLLPNTQTSVGGGFIVTSAGGSFGMSR